MKSAKRSLKAKARGNAKFRPTVWIDGPHMYATCPWLSYSSYSDTKFRDRMTFENRLWRHIKEIYDILPNALTLNYLDGKVQINFDNDEDFVMLKLGMNL